MTQQIDDSKKCHRKKYFFFGNKIGHNYQIERLWQHRKGDSTFCFSARCKRCGITQLWRDMSEDIIVKDWGIDKQTLWAVRERHPNAYYHLPIQQQKTVTP